jgi:hypothetical protein
MTLHAVLGYESSAMARVARELSGGSHVTDLIVRHASW